MAESVGAIRIHNRTRLRDESGRFLAEVHKGASRAALAIANLGLRVAGNAAPKRTGRLRASARSRRTGPYTAEVSFAAPYAQEQESGAGPHSIGRPGQILANKEQEFGPTRGPVNHPGNPATHFMRKGYDAAAAAGENIAAQYLPES